MIKSINEGIVVGVIILLLASASILILFDILQKNNCAENPLKYFEAKTDSMCTCSGTVTGVARLKIYTSSG